ncbi:hypothetical protein L5515_005990 [Caenorhabditis briggsae]|uniref:Protein sleepless n=3 Tax=Caenorhabditis briggsae TaxID=6238 RepID=A0AAE9EUT5_CAEBR|nr:hypothetical protein L5515_005990 [Caenorhabditis briggsae]
MSPRILILFFILVFFLITPINPLQCHQCGGAERMSRTTKRLYMDLNISPDLYYGNCRSKSGNDVCTNGTFCIKRAKIHRIGFNRFNYKYTTYTKGCANIREDNGQAIVDGCYDLNQDTSNVGFSTKRVDCYCDTDFCNSSSRFHIILMTIFWITFSF